VRTSAAAVRALLVGLAVLIPQETGVLTDGSARAGVSLVRPIPKPEKPAEAERPAPDFARRAAAKVTPTPIRKPAKLRASPDVVLAGGAENDEPLEVGKLEDRSRAQPERGRSRTDEPSSPAVTPRLDPKSSQSPDNATTDDATRAQRLAQFQIKDPKKNGKAELPTRLEYQYAYGSESEINYRDNLDLDDRVRDDVTILTPQVNGYVTYRPADWFEATLELILEHDIAAHEEDRIALPNGDIQLRQKRRPSLLVDQAFVTFKEGPLELSVGRKNFEDLPRHWLYDTSMDAVSLLIKTGMFRTTASVGREILVDMDVFQREPTDKIDTYILDTEYRGIEDIKLAAYGIRREDKTREEGDRWVWGLRSTGMPNENFSYWGDLAYMHGQDSRSRRIAAYAFDVGATYRFAETRFMPNVTLGFALGSGDENTSDRTINEFHQTGLQSNEVKFAGLSEFKGYGEALDPELSNLQILTVGAGLRPALNVSVDVVYHRYWLDEFADELTNTGLTAEPNQIDTITSNEVGSGLDVILGLRSVFGIPRLGMDFRTGVFLPSKAYLIDESVGPLVRSRKPDNASAVVVKLWW
jgi:alginate production protein